MTVPNTWMPAAKMSRIHIHWTAGGHSANATDKKSYHILIQGNGTLIRGNRPIDANEPGSTNKPPASHTKNANTGAIGVSMCCMVGGEENPFKAGKSPLTSKQWDAMIDVVAELAERYNIPVTSKTILTHAEVEPNLGIPQTGKWDVTRVAFDLSLKGHKPVGDKIRKDVAVALGKLKGGSGAGSGTAIPASMKPEKFKVTGVAPETLNFRDNPGGAKKGELPENTVVEKLNDDGDWWQVRTPGGFVGWVSSEFLKPA